MPVDQNHISLLFNFVRVELRVSSLMKIMIGLSGSLGQPLVIDFIAGHVFYLAPKKEAGTIKVIVT